MTQSWEGQGSSGSLREKGASTNGWEEPQPNQRKNMAGEGTAATESTVGDQNSGEGGHPVDFKNMSARILHVL